MSILIVDDGEDSRLLVKSILNNSGYTDVILSESAEDAFKQLEMHPSGEIDLILMDILMPGIDGIEACLRIKANKHFLDIPIIMVTAKTEAESLQLAFASGAVDYVTKPFNKVEMLARVRSVLKLKHEMDQRKARESELMEVTRQLEAANQILQKLSSIDGLTGIANRRSFDEFLESELRRYKRMGIPLSLILIDVDNFKAYNDAYGHLMGDDCLKKVANVLVEPLKRQGDLAARYGGEEFAVVLSDTNIEGAKILAEKIRGNVANLKISHTHSNPCGHVTVSLGVATIIPDHNSMPDDIIKLADSALYEAKQEGRNKVVVKIKLDDIG